MINQNLYPKLDFDPTKFVPDHRDGADAELAGGHAEFPPKTVAEVIAYAKANPGKVNSAIQGNGTTSHLTSEMFQMMAGVKFQHVPYHGSAPALNDLVGGSVDIMFDNLGVSLALVKGGKLRLLAVASPKRMASLPDVPTIARDAAGLRVGGFFAVVAPPKTPQQIVEQNQRRHQRGAAAARAGAALGEPSAETVGGTLKETADYMHDEVERLEQGDQGRQRETCNEQWPAPGS